MGRLLQALELAGLIALCAFMSLFTFCWFTIFPAMGLLWCFGVLK